MSIETEKLKNILEAALLAYGEPLSLDRLLNLFTEDEPVSRQEIRDTLQQLQQDCEGRSVELVEVGSGFRYQARKDYAQWVSRLWEEKPPRYSRALLETLALVAYRQPITRAEVEDVRGVSVSTHIMKTLQERDWVRVVGHKDVPGKPSLYATTKAFLDYFNLKSLDELPSLMEIRDLDKINSELDLQAAPEPAGDVEENNENKQVSVLADEPDERLMSDGEGDHGDGIDEDSDEVSVEVSADAGEGLALVQNSISVDAVNQGQDEQAAVEITESSDHEESSLGQFVDQEQSTAQGSDLKESATISGESAAEADLDDSSLYETEMLEAIMSEENPSAEEALQASRFETIEDRNGGDHHSEDLHSDSEQSNTEYNESDYVEYDYNDSDGFESAEIEVVGFEKADVETADIQKAGNQKAGTQKESSEPTSTTSTNFNKTDSDEARTVTKDSRYKHKGYEERADHENDFSEDEHESERLSAAEPNT